ncbi:MAG: hypothetical protein JOZ39_06305, partial [Chloroflexi bacterium]|nr:hypothetical protein [Chloroflexota bacterium]
MKQKLRFEWPVWLLLVAAVGFFWQSTLAGKLLLPVDDLFQFPPWSSYAPSGFAGPHNGLIADSILENYGWKRFLLDSLHNRQLPLWNPNILAGTPFLAPGQASVLYPFVLLWLILPVAHAYGYFAALHLFFAGAGAYCYLRYHSVSRAGGLVGGLAYMFSGRLVTSILWPQMIGAIVYLPLLLLIVDICIRQASKRWPVWPPIVGAVVLGVSILAGHIEASVYVMACIGLYALARLLLAPASLGCRVRIALSAGLMLALGAGVAAVQLLPFYEVGSRNFRSGSVTYQDVTRFALKLPQLFTFAMPDFYGNPVIHWAPYWGAKDYVEQAAYIGVLPAMLALASLVWVLVHGRASRQERHGDTWQGVAALWCVVLVSLLLAFGTPLYRVIFFLLPGFNQIHSPFR